MDDKPPPASGQGLTRSTAERAWGERGKPVTSKVAWVAAVSGALGLLLVGVPILSCVALFLGLMSASDIKSSGGREVGLLPARVGWVLGAVGLLIFSVLMAIDMWGWVTEDDTDRGTAPWAVSL